jgi:hypothetical protein
MLISYSRLLKKLVPHSSSQIVVAGPHRSGTTFVTKVLAADLECKCCLEEGMGNVLAFLHGALKSNEAHGVPAVYQAPLLTAYCHALPESAVVVYLYRPVKDIMASELRLGWSKNPAAFENDFKKKELSKYFAEYKCEYNNSCAAGLAQELKKDPDHRLWCKRPMSEVKYMIWEKYQKKLVKHSYDLDYDSLKGHRLWIDKKLRAGFSGRQTELGC